MNTKEVVLKTLIANSNEYISGEDLAAKTRRSRAAIWKAIESLRQDGFIIDASTNKGYCLNDENDVLSQEIIRLKMKKKYSDIEIRYYPTIDSTNEEAKRLVLDGNKNDLLLVAEEQTDGRGRTGGKSFYSPPLTGIYMTLVLHKIQHIRSALKITTAASVAVCKTIEKLTDLKPQIKWVNDVYLDDKKVCGILCEAQHDKNNFETTTALVIGIGMNVRTLDFPKEVENAGALNVPVKRAELIAELVNQLVKISEKEYDFFINYYRKHSMIIGRDIEVIENGKVRQAKAIAITGNGGLLVSYGSLDARILHSGEISIKKIDKK